MNNDTLIDLLIFILYCILYSVIGIPLLLFGLIFSILVLPVFAILRFISVLVNSDEVYEFNKKVENIVFNTLGVGPVIILKISELIDKLR